MSVIWSIWCCLKKDCVMDLYFGTDYHSHLGSSRGGMAVFSETCFPAIHNIENIQFRAKFESDLAGMSVIWA